MSFNVIELDTWKRKSYYQHYVHTVRCTYSITVNIEIDSLVKELKLRGIKAYPAQVYILSRAVNNFQEFRMAINTHGELGYWESTSPSYTILNKDTETFSSIFTPFDSDFSKFYDKCIHDMEKYGNSDTLFPQNNMPENLFTISSFPWQSFTGFNLNVYGEGTYLPPIFTIGRYLEQNGKTHMPLSIQVHHAVCDGYHVGKFIDAVQGLAQNFSDWL